MGGMDGFEHICSDEKCDINCFKMSISQSNFTKNQIDIIWDFYVTHSIAGKSNQTIKLDEYGWNIQEEKANEIEKLLMKSANIS